MALPTTYAPGDTYTAAAKNAENVQVNANTDAIALNTAAIATKADNGLTSAPVHNLIEIGNANDTTLTRAESGLLAVEGVNIPTITGAKRIAVVTSIPGSPDPNTVYIVNDAGALRVVTVASTATPSINVDITDQVEMLTLVNNITSFTFTGTLRPAQPLAFVFKSAANQTITWGTSVIAGPAPLLTGTLAGKYHEVVLKYNSTAAKLVCMAADATGY